MYGACYFGLYTTYPTSRTKVHNIQDTITIKPYRKRTSEQNETKMDTDSSIHDLEKGPSDTFRRRHVSHHGKYFSFI